MSTEFSGKTVRKLIKQNQKNSEFIDKKVTYSSQNSRMMKKKTDCYQIVIYYSFICDEECVILEIRLRRIRQKNRNI